MPHFPLPTTNGLPFYRYRDGLYAADLIAAAINGFDFFSRLASQPDSLEGICQSFGFHPRPADVLLTLCRANGLVDLIDGRYHVSAIAREHATQGSPWNLAPYFASLHHRPVARDFLTVLTSGKPAGWSGDQDSADWHKAMEDPAFASSFTNAMDCRGAWLAPALAAALDLSSRHHVIDIGGGSGIYACALAAANPHLHAVVFDQSPVDRIAANLIASRDCSAQVSVAAGNMFDGLPNHADVHLFSNVLHDWDVPEVTQLLAVSAAHLRKGGLLVIHDAFINPDKSGPLHIAEYSALLMHSTQGKCYSSSEYAALLDAAGFSPGPYSDTAAGRGFMTALRR